MAVGRTHRYGGHTGIITCLVRVPGDARRFFSGSADRTVRLWCLDDGSCLATLRGHTGSVSSVLITSTAVLTGSSDCSVRCWSRIDHKVVRVIHGHSDAVRALAPHHTRVRPTLYCGTLVCHRVPPCVRVSLLSTCARPWAASTGWVPPCVHRIRRRLHQELGPGAGRGTTTHALGPIDMAQRC